MPTGSAARKKPRLVTADAARTAQPRGSRANESRDYASKYQILFDQASDAILSVLPSGEVDAINQAGEELTGYMKAELQGSSLAVLSPDATQHRIPERSRPLDISIFRSGGTYEDIAIVRKDGYVRLVDISVRMVSSGETMLALAMLRDLTEKKRMERELITKHGELRNAYYQLERKNVELQSMQDTLVQAGKMAALGELATGIAHELNQPLQAIRGYAQELSDYALPQLQGRSGAEEAESAAREIVANVDKMAGIIDYLRTFNRKSTEKHEFVDVHAAIEEALKMLRRQFGARGIQVQREYGPGVPLVYANPLQLEQVFINLCTNARDAIEQTGRGSGKVSVTTRKHESFVEIEFCDDGCGMTDRTKTKAFNPFFTTKEVGQGMGLGLSLSYGMIAKLHGSIVVESELGKGTAFLIRLPRDFRELA